MTAQTNTGAMVPRRAYVEDAIEGDDANAIAVIDVPPPCPTPPPAADTGELPANVNVFDFLVSEETPSGSRGTIPAPKERRKIEHTPRYEYREPQFSQNSQFSNGGGSQYLQHGFSYGSGPLQPNFERYDSWNDLTGAQPAQLMPPPSYVTPGPKEQRREKRDKHITEKSDKKRKRNVEELDLSSAKRPGSRDAIMSDAPILNSGGRVLHSGLTGGLNRLVTDPDFLEDRIEAGPTPISPVKRSKRDRDSKSDKDPKDERRKSSYTSQSIKAPPSKHIDDKHQSPRNVDRQYNNDRHKSSRRRDSFSSDERSYASRRTQKTIEHLDRPGSVQPSTKNQLVQYKNRAEHFMSFVTKGPDSHHGCSINKALKRYHRERDVRSDEKEDEDKELWKSLRLRRNSRGEIVLFTE